MKKLLMAALIVAMGAWSIPLLAGEPGHRSGGQTHEERRARMQQALGLTEAQMEEMREIRENGGTREDMHAVLTEEQRATLEEMRANRQARGGHGKRRGGPPPETADEYGDTDIDKS